MLTAIAHNMLVAYAVTLSELSRPRSKDALLQEFLRREHLDAQDDLYSHLWEFFGGRLEVGSLIVSADNEGEVKFRLRGRTASAWFAPASAN